MTFLPIASISTGQDLPGALEAMAAGSLGGVLVEGLYDSSALACLNDRLDADTELPRTDFPGFTDDPDPPRLYGRSLVDCPADLKAYFADAARLRSGLTRLFDGLVPFEQHLTAVLHALGGTARCAEAAPHRYSPATIRHLPPGHAIGLHIGNAFLTTPQAQQLARSVHVGAQLSHFMPLRLPSAGGELVVYDLRWSMVKDRYEGGVDVREEDGLAKLVLPLCETVRISPPAGAMLIFDGGRFFHRITPVEGSHARRTIGGFLAQAHRGTGWRYWS